MTQLPPDGPDQAYVQISFLPGGSITLPEKSFIQPSDVQTRNTVPSLAFLVSQSGKSGTRRPIKLMFDLGLRSRGDHYSATQQTHLESRVPYSLGPSIVDQLVEGGVHPLLDVQAVIMSHVHYDHHGDPEDFEDSLFIVGHGSFRLLRDGLGDRCSHQHFQADLLRKVQAIELPSNSSDEVLRVTFNDGTEVKCQWAPLGPFPSTMDLLMDGSVYIVDSPGHLPGHINLLCRIGPQKWVYLAGDACHDVRLLTGEKEIATWKDADGALCCIHVDKVIATQTLTRIAALMSAHGPNFQVILAHDWEWYVRHEEQRFPNTIAF